MRRKPELSEENIGKFQRALYREERERSTVEVYLRNLRRFAAWAEGGAADKETALCWKEALLKQGYSPVTINAMLAAVNKFFVLMGCPSHKVRYLRVQRRVFRAASRELTRQEYQRLVDTAYELGDQRLALVMETLCATGIRVSELRYVTVEALAAGAAEVRLKGKVRTILIPGKLRRKLLEYAGRQNITSGEIFLTRGGRSLSRKFIWAEMKRVCERAEVARSKVFPHNLRHLFARAFYRVCGDVVKLADILGHASIETTRLYLVATGKEYARQLDRLGLVS